MKIGVHSGAFHADDVLSAVLLKELDEYKDAEIIRTRDPAILETCEVVCDVGCVYNHDEKRYDHHQPGWDFKFPGSQVVAASCGTIYFHYGLEIVSKLLHELNFNDFTDEERKIIWKMLYTNFIEEIDGNDNGIAAASVEANYSIKTSISMRIARMNPHWKEPEADPDVRFKEAMVLMRSDLLRFLRHICTTLYPLEKEVKHAFDTRYDLHPSGRAIQLKGKCPFNMAISKVEKEADKPGEILYCLIPRVGGAEWTIQCVNQNMAMTPRKRLDWGSLPKEEQDVKIKEACGIDDLLFIHKTGFLGVVKSRESALKWLSYAIESE